MAVVAGMKKPVDHAEPNAKNTKRLLTPVELLTHTASYFILHILTQRLHYRQYLLLYTEIMENYRKLMYYH